MCTVCHTMSHGNFWNISHVDYAKILNDDILDGMVLGDIFWPWNKRETGAQKLEQVTERYPIGYPNTFFFTYSFKWLYSLSFRSCLSEYVSFLHSKCSFFSLNLSLGRDMCGPDFQSMQFPFGQKSTTPTVTILSLCHFFSNVISAPAQVAPRACAPSCPPLATPLVWGAVPP